MKLVTFQTREALNILQNTGVLTAEISYIDIKKYGVPYNWMTNEMKNKNILPQHQEQYPLWAWAKCGASIAPRKRKNTTGEIQDAVKIIFEKSDKDVLLSDYMAYSFLLSGHIVPRTPQEYKNFLDEMKQQNISLEELKNFVRSQPVKQDTVKQFSKIEKTWKRIFNLKSGVYQACVWDIKMSEVLKIEILDNTNYIYGAMNTKHLDGSRPDWKKKYLQFLPTKSK